MKPVFAHLIDADSDILLQLCSLLAVREKLFRFQHWVNPKAVFSHLSDAVSDALPEL